MFAVVATALFFAINYYIYRRFLLKLSFLRPYPGGVRLLFWTLFTAEMLYFVSLSREWLPPMFYTLFASLIGVSFMLFCVALVYDLLRFPIARFGGDGARKEGLHKLLEGVVLLLAGLYLYSGFAGGQAAAQVRSYSVALEGLTRPSRIALLSDLHIGKSLQRDYLEEIVTRTNAQKPDLVAIVGDLVDLRAEQIGTLLDPLRRLEAPLGVYFVLGNHEYFHGPYAIMEHLKSLGLRVLVNENIPIGERFTLAGVADMMGLRAGALQPDLTKALQGADPTLPVVLLAHQPKFTRLIGDAKVDLVLSGHTHGGQIFPFGALVLLDQPYLSGLYPVDADTQIVVSNGTGYWGPPIRVLAPSQIVLVDLIPKE